MRVSPPGDYVRPGRLRSRSSAARARRRQAMVEREPSTSQSIAPSSRSFAVPPLPRGLVERERVLDLLDGVLDRPLTTMTAPAGYGKSVVAAHWCRQRCPTPVGWLRLGREDKDPALLLKRLAAAVTELTGASLPDVDRWPAADWARLDRSTIDRLSEILDGCRDAVLVVDGLRASGPVGLYADVAMALEQAHDCGLHLLAVSRCLPPPSLIALQLRGTVAHVTAADLRLDASEASAVVEAYSGRGVSESTAAELTDRLEGWMAGAVIVALSRPPGDAATDDLMIAAADGIGHFVQTEVIDPLPGDVRSFLRRTSGPGELTGQLCDRLTGGSDGEETLHALRAHGLAVFIGSGGSGTFRYHAPLRELLDAHHRRQDSQARDEALRSAASWYADHRQPLDAAEVYARVGDWDAVGAVVMGHAKEIIENDEFGRVAALVTNAPPAVLQQHTEWAVAGAAFLASAGRIAAANEILHYYEPHFTTAKLMVADLVRGDGVAWLDDMTVPVEAAEAALAAADVLGDEHRYQDLYSGPPSTTDYYRLSAHCKAALACAFAGWWERGRPHLVTIAPDQAASLPHVRYVQFLGERALTLALAGESRKARSEAEQALAAATQAAMADNRQAAAGYWALGETFRLSGATERVGDLLDQALALSRINGRHNLIAGIVASQAHLRVDVGDPSGAMAILDAHRAATAHRPPLTIAGLLAAAEARALAATGEVLLALDLLGREPVTSATAAVEVRIALTVGERARAREALEHWPRERTVLSTVRYGLAKAMLLEVSGSSADASDRIRVALAQASRADLVQPIVDWETAMMRPLRRIGRSEGRSSVAALARRAQVLIEARGTGQARFTAQEAAVLAHLGRGLSIPAIAAEMYLSANTVKTYVKAIYRKLGVSSRSEALSIWRASLQGNRPSADD